MSFTPFENTAQMDDRLVSFDKVPQEANKENVIRRLTRNWENVKSDLNGLGGIKLVQKVDWGMVADALIKGKSHAVMFDLVLTKTDFRLNILAGDVTVKGGSVNVPTEREAYRDFLGSLNGWSNSAQNIVPDADFKAFNAKFPKKPTEYKDFDEMAKKSKSDVDGFRTWANGNSGAKKAFADIDKTAKAKPSDPTRAGALKAINASLKEYYKSF
jgi:hypothetical protein